MYVVTYRRYVDPESATPVFCVKHPSHPSIVATLVKLRFWNKQNVILPVCVVNTPDDARNEDWERRMGGTSFRDKLCDMIIGTRARFLLGYFGTHCLHLVTILRDTNAQIGHDVFTPRFRLTNPVSKHYTKVAPFPLSLFVYGPHQDIKFPDPKTLPALAEMQLLPSMPIEPLPTEVQDILQLTRYLGSPDPSEFEPRSKLTKARHIIEDILRDMFEEYDGESIKSAVRTTDHVYCEIATWDWDSWDKDGDWNNCQNLGNIKMKFPETPWNGDYSYAPSNDVMNAMDNSKRSSWAMHFPGVVQSFFYIGTPRSGRVSRKSAGVRWESNFEKRKRGLPVAKDKLPSTTLWGYDDLFDEGEFSVKKQKGPRVAIL
jgi:hypothetical protein